MQAYALPAALLQKLAKELRDLHQRPEEGIRVSVHVHADCFLYAHLQQATTQMRSAHYCRSQ